MEVASELMLHADRQGAAGVLMSPRLQAQGEEGNKMADGRDWAVISRLGQIILIRGYQREVNVDFSVVCVSVFCTVCEMD